MAPGNRVRNGLWAVSAAAVSFVAQARFDARSGRGPCSRERQDQTVGRPGRSREGDWLFSLEYCDGRFGTVECRECGFGPPAHPEAWPHNPPSKLSPCRQERSSLLLTLSLLSHR